MYVLKYIYIQTDKKSRYINVYNIYGNVICFNLYFGHS